METSDYLRILKEEIHSAVFATVAVSYTHLDVYKRQRDTGPCGGSALERGGCAERRGSGDPGGQRPAGVFPGSGYRLSLIHI